MLNQYFSLFHTGQNPGNIPFHLLLMFQPSIIILSEKFIGIFCIFIFNKDSSSSSSSIYSHDLKYDDKLCCRSRLIYRLASIAVIAFSCVPSSTFV